MQFWRDSAASCCRISALEHQSPLVGTRRAVFALMSDDDFVDVKHIIEQAPLLTDFGTASG